MLKVSVVCSCTFHESLDLDYLVSVLRDLLNVWFRTRTSIMKSSFNEWQEPSLTPGLVHVEQELYKIEKPQWIFCLRRSREGDAMWSDGVRTIDWKPTMERDYTWYLFRPFWAMVNTVVIVSTPHLTWVWDILTHEGSFPEPRIAWLSRHWVMIRRKFFLYSVPFVTVFGP